MITNLPPIPNIELFNKLIDFFGQAFANYQLLCTIILVIIAFGFVSILSFVAFKAIMKAGI